MQATSGWKWLVTEMQNARSDAMSNLVSSNNVEQDLKYKSIIRGMDFIFTQIDTFLAYKDTVEYEMNKDFMEELNVE